MYFNMFVHNNIGGTLKKNFHPPFWGGTAPPTVGVGSRGSILGHVLKSIWSVFFSLSYIPNKTKQPKIWRFCPIKKFAPLKTEAKSASPKIRIFGACSNFLPHNSPLSTLVSNLWIEIERRGIRALIKTNLCRF